MGHAELQELEGGYYATIPAPVMRDATLRWASMVLYANITSYARKTGFCYASNATLIREMTRIDPETGMEQPITERTLQSMLAELKDRGHIWTDIGPYPPDKNGTIRKGRRIYIGRTLVPPVQGEENFTPENNFTQGVKKSSPPFKCNNNTANNKPPKSPTEVLDAIDAYIGDDPEYWEAFEGFLQNRIALKKPVLTSRAINTIINRLRKACHRETEIAMLDKATENNWLTVYPLKPDEMPVQAAPTQGDEEGIDGI